LLAIPYIKDGEIAERNLINIPVNSAVLNKLSGDDDDDDDIASDAAARWCTSASRSTVASSVAMKKSRKI
jgi:hypothetical protein